VNVATHVCSQDELVAQLRALGVRPGMILLAHTSFRAVRPVEGGPSGLIAALREALGPQGTLVMPSMTGSKATEPFDPALTPATGMGGGGHLLAPAAFGAAITPPPPSPRWTGGAYLTRPQPSFPVHGTESLVGWLHALDGASCSWG
jgi:aminoglycoside 3-N-acetyltransferase